MILIDSCVLIDIFTVDPEWYEWSLNALEEAANHELLAINPVIYGEISFRFASIDELETAFPYSMIRREPLPYEAAFVAGKAYLQYRRRGGTRTSTLPDFFIGAHAAVSKLELLTRDPRKFRRYFPTVKLICP